MAAQQRKPTRTFSYHQPGENNTFFLLLFRRLSHRPDDSELDEFHPRATRYLFVGGLPRDAPLPAGPLDAAAVEEAVKAKAEVKQKRTEDESDSDSGDEDLDMFNWRKKS